MTTTPAGGSDQPRSLGSLIGLGILAVFLVATLAGLGTWQVQRRAWKLDLVARVEARIHAPPEPAPVPEQWPATTAARDEYRHVLVTGAFETRAQTFVQAVTDFGPGFWVLTPLRTTQGFTVLVNRGFVPSDLRQAFGSAPSEPEGEATVTGLLRMSEPGGGFLRRNDPARDRWYSRDVPAIAAARHVGNVAPYFVDVDGPPDPTRLPVGGLTVVQFPNNHLAYALTWYGLALLLLGATVAVGRDEWRRRRPASVDPT